MLLKISYYKQNKMYKDYKVIDKENIPKAGEVYRHYKGGLYEVVTVAMHSDPDEFCVVYKAKNINPTFPFFTRLLRSWNEEVECKGEKVKRFTKMET